LRPVGGASGAGAPLAIRGGVDAFEANAAVERRLADFLAERCGELERCDPLTAELTDGLRALVDAGGKRLRPAFVHWGHRAAGAEAPSAASVDAAAAVELLHTFALVHDDVMDGATTRRRRPSVHVALGELRTAELGAALAARFGESAAILVGDLAFAWAHELLAGIDIGTASPRLRTVFATLCAEAVAGQYLDVRLARADALDAQARAIAVLKSGRYTVTRPLELGAVTGGADARTIDALRRYGDAVGVAFQLRDDVLGVFGDDAATGKSSLDDLRDGKASLLLVRARRLADPAGRRLLADCVGRADLDHADADRCRDVIMASGALASVERLIADRTDVAIDALETLHPPARDALAALAVAATRRAA
jgi:geranylgeranyl diphosphate synthase type I